MKSRGRYTPEQRARGCERAIAAGPAVASKELNIPERTLGTWLSLRRNGKGPAGVVATSSGTSRGPGVSPTVSQGVGGGPEAAGPPSSSRKQIARRYTPSEKARALEYASKHGITATMRELGMSRFSLYNWRRQVEAAQRGEGESPTTGPDPADIEAQRDREILAEWKRQPGLGPSQIRNQLRRKGIKVAVNTVSRVMTEAGYRPPKVRSHKHDERYEAVRPNQLWHLDYVQRFINRTSTFSLILIDDYSRFVVGHGVDDAERADMVIETFENAVTQFGRPEMVIHDRGSAFWSWKGISRFTKLLVELGVDQIAAPHKEWNGKIEVFNSNLAKELFNVHRFYDVSEMKRRLGAHINWYNHQRTHHALGGLIVPADRYYGREKEVLARIAAGVTGLPDLHAIDLRDRPLDLFKVVELNNKMEVWLMGQKVFG
jgi:putative transposase